MDDNADAKHFSDIPSSPLMSERDYMDVFELHGWRQS